TWEVPTTTPTCSAGKSAARSRHCSRVESTARSAAKIGCSGSSTSRTPCSAANGASSPTRSATRCRAATRSRSPLGVGGPPGPLAAGSPPTTITSSLVPRVAASVIAALLSASASACPVGSAAVRNPPRHSEETRSPEALTIRAAFSRPASATRSRHRPTAPRPARVATSTASASVSALVVAVFRDSRLRSPVGKSVTVGSLLVRAGSEGDRLERDAAALRRGGQTGLGQLHAAGGREQVVAVLPAGEHVAQELLPLGLEAVLLLGVRRHLQPLVAERLGGRQVRVPHRLRGVRPLLGHAVAQARDRGPVRAVHLELHQLVPVDAHRPGGVDLGDDLLTGGPGDLEDPVGGVVGGGRVLLALLVPSGGDVRDGLGGHGLHRTEDALEHVVPVAEHVRGHATAVL